MNERRMFAASAEEIARAKKFGKRESSTDPATGLTVVMYQWNGKTYVTEVIGREKTHPNAV